MLRSCCAIVGCVTISCTADEPRSQAGKWHEAQGACPFRHQDGLEHAAQAMHQRSGMVVLACDKLGRRNKAAAASTHL